MYNNYPLRTFNSSERVSQRQGFPARAYDPLPFERVFSIPRKPTPYTGIDNDQAALIDPSDPAAAPGLRLHMHGKPFLRWWLPELFASILSIASLLAIVIVLHTYNGRGINDLNLPTSLTLNGIVAAISTFNRVCLMVPVGAALSQEAWLWFSTAGHQEANHSRLGDLDLSDGASRGAWGSIIFLCFSRRRYLASMGAILSILSLGLGTFTQQLIAMDNSAITDPASRLSPGNIPRAENWTRWTGNPAEAQWGPYLDMKAAVYNGMLTEDIVPLEANCPSGNCSWPLTPSMAVCGGCAPSAYTTTSCNATFCNYTMASGSVASLYNQAGGDDVIEFQVQSSHGAHFNISRYDRLYIANFDMFGAPYNSFSTGWDNKSTISSECALWMCVQTFNVSTRSGQQVQTVASSYSTINSNPAEASEYLFKDLPADLHGTEHTNFTVDYFAWGALSTYFAGLVTGTVSLNLESQGFSSDVVEAIWNGTQNLDKWIDNLATSMTNNVRTGSPLSRPIYNGTAYQLGVKVRWIWIALPTAIVLFSLIFLGIVIVKTARSPVEAWKGSPLAFLFFDVDPDTKRTIFGHTDKFRGIENSVGEKRAVLKGQPGGSWTFQAA